MASIEEILGKQINSVKELRAEIKNLQDSLIGVDTESEQFKTTSQQLAAAQEELTKVTRAGKEENVAAKDSIVGMKNEYKALYDQYKLLSDEQRNSDFGKNMASSLETLSSKINETQKGVGSFKDNIGNYAASVSEAFNKMGISIGGLQGPFKAAQTASGGLNTAFKTLAANPIMLAITAIVAILVKAAAAIKKNEELTMRLQQALSVFKPVLDAVSNAFDFLAGILVKVIEGLSKVAEKVMSIIPGMKKAIDSHKELAKATNDLTKATREANIENSKKTAEIERLREEASATEDVTEKKRLLEEAKRMQAEVDQANIEIAQEELRIMEEYAAKTANNTEANEKLAAAQKKVNDAIAQSERNARMYNKQLDAATNKSNTAASAGKSEWEEEEEELAKFNEEYKKSLKTREQLVNEHYDALLEKAEKHKQDTTNIEKARQKELNEIRLDGMARAREDIEQQIQLNENAGEKVLAIEQRLESLTDAKEGAQVKLANVQKMVDDIIDGLVDESKLDATNMETFSKTIDAALEKAKKWEDFVNAEGFDALGDDYQELKDAVAEINAEFGLSITTLTNLDNATEEVRQRVLELKGEWHKGMIDMKVTEEAKAQLEGLIKTVTYDTYEGYLAYVEELNRKSLEIEKSAIEEQLENFEGTDQQKLELLQRYYAAVAELRQKDYEDEKAKQEALEELKELQTTRTEEMIASLIDMTDKIASSLSSYKSTRESVIDSEVKAGNISEKEGKRRKKNLLALERAERDFAVAAIAADAATGIVKIWRGWATETGEVNPVTAAGNAYYLAALNAKSTIAAVAKTAGLAATATAQIAAAKGKYVVAKNNMEAEEGGASTGVAAAPMLIDSSPVSYTRTVQTAEEEDAINQRPIVCSIVDIEDAMDARKVRVTETSF